MAAYELKYTAEEIDGILESVDEKTIYDDATQSEHGLMSTTDKSKLDSLPSSQQINASLSGKVDKVDGKGLSTNDYDATAKAKVDAIPADPKYTDTVYDDTALAGRVSTIESKESGWDAKQDALESGTNIKTVNGESLLGSGNIEIQGGGGEENVIEAITMNGASVPVTNKTAAITETDPTVPSWAKQPNKPSYNYSEIGNTPTIPVVPTNVSAFNNDAGYLTSHQDLSNYIQKSQTAGLIKNDGTVDTTQYGTYSKPSGGIPASDIASGVIPTIPVQDVTVGGTSVVSNGTAVIPAIPDTSGKEDRMLISSASGTTLSAVANTYHNFTSEVNTLAITLPAVTDVTHITNIVFMLTTGTTPAITFVASATGVNVIAQDGFSIEASTTYEINAIFNGTMWVVAAMKLSTTPINS